jgi:hypothetical protein
MTKDQMIEAIGDAAKEIVKKLMDNFQFQRNAGDAEAEREMRKGLVGLIENHDAMVKAASEIMGKP